MWFGKKTAHLKKEIQALRKIAVKAIASEEWMQGELRHMDKVVLFYVSRCRELEDALVTCCGKRLPTAGPPVRRP